MGTSFSVRVFFGTFLPRASRLGQALRRYIDQHGGTPAPAVQGVVVSTAGSEEASFITVEIDTAGMALQSWADHLDERLDISPPAAIPPAPPEWRTRIAVFLANEMTELRNSGRAKGSLLPDDFSPIGFHVAGTRM